MTSSARTATPSSLSSPRPASGSATIRTLSSASSASSSANPKSVAWKLCAVSSAVTTSAFDAVGAMLTLLTGVSTVCARAGRAAPSMTATRSRTAAAARPGKAGHRGRESAAGRCTPERLGPAMPRPGSRPLLTLPLMTTPPAAEALRGSPPLRAGAVTGAAGTRVRALPAGRARAQLPRDAVCRTPPAASAAGSRSPP